MDSCLQKSQTVLFNQESLQEIDINYVKSTFSVVDFGSGQIRVGGMQFTKKLTFSSDALSKIHIVTHSFFCCFHAEIQFLR